MRAHTINCRACGAGVQPHEPACTYCLTTPEVPAQAEVRYQLVSKGRANFGAVIESVLITGGQIKELMAGESVQFGSDQ